MRVVSLVLSLSEKWISGFPKMYNFFVSSQDFLCYFPQTLWKCISNFLLSIFILYFTEFASYIDLILFHLSFLFEWNTIRSGTIGYFSHGKPIKVPSSHTVGLIVLLKHCPHIQECGLYKVCHALFTLVSVKISIITSDFSEPTLTDVVSVNRILSNPSCWN